MQHLKVVIFAVLVVMFVLRAEGLPYDGSNDKAGGDENHPSSTDSESSMNINDGRKGIVIEANGAVKGLLPNTEYNITQLTEALSKVNTESLSYSLGLSPFVDLSNTFVQLILGQSRIPQNGVINYETAFLFVQKLSIGTPQIAKALKTVSYVMMKIKELEDESKPLDMKVLIPEALEFFYGAENVNQYFREKWLKDVAPLIRAAVDGDEGAAKSIVDHLEAENKDFKGLKLANPKVLQTILEKSVESVFTNARILQLKADNTPWEFEELND